MRSFSVVRLLSLAIILGAVACDEAGIDETSAKLYWQQPDSLTLGISRPTDVEAISRESMWVADATLGAILALSPGTGEYASIGEGQRPPPEVKQPLRIALAPDVGLASYDAETGDVGLFTLEGNYIRSFSPGFEPAVVSFSHEPLGYTFAVVAADSGGDRHAVVIHTDLTGTRRDTLLSSGHGPATLRESGLRVGETVMSPSREGMWVWTTTAPDSVYDVTPGGTRRMALRDSDTAAVSMFADRKREILWMVRVDSAAMKYAAYDTRWVASGDRISTDADTLTNPPFLGTRTTPLSFRPMVIEDGVVMGFRQVRGGLRATAYDLAVERFARTTRGHD